MKPGVPWSVKGIEPELREAAKTAARRSGMTLGEWLNSAINEQAETDVVMPDLSPRNRGAQRQRHESNEHPIERAASKLEDIAEKLARLQPVESEATFRGNPQLDSNVNFAKILSRVETHEKQTIEAFESVNERLSTISKQIVRHSVPQQKFEETPSYQALEKAVRNIIEHLDVSDKRTRENMKTLQDRMTEMSQRLGGGDQILKQAPAFNALETRLAELTRKVEQPGQSPGDLLRAEIEQLAHRIDAVRDSSEQLANRAQTQAVQAAQSELRAIEGRLINLLNEAKQSIMANHVGPAELQRFKGEIDKLHGRIDDAQRSAATDRDVSALKVAIEQLSSRIGSDQKPIAELDRRILEIAQKLERAEQQGLGSSATQEVERRFAELDQRLSSPAGDNSKMREMDDRLARTEQQLTHLETIERALAQLYEAFEENRKNPQAPAGGAAAATPASIAGSPEIVALENGLKAVREAAVTADARNQETLEAVHGTLEQIVSKLAELETAAIGQRVGAAVAPQAPIENPFVPKEEVKGQDPFVSAEPEVKAEPALSLDEPAAPVNPFEPAEDLIQTGSTTSAETGISDLIAAARKLHQQNNGGAASGQLSSFVPGKGKAKAEKSSKGFKLPFLSSDAGKTAKPLVTKPANGNEAGSKRRLVFLGILLLAVATFATTNMLSRSRPVAPQTTPTSIEQPSTPPAAAPAAPLNTNQSGPIPLPGDANAPAAAAPDQGSAAKVPPLPDPAPAPLANPGQSSDASDSLLQTDPITTGSVSAAATKGDNISALDPSVGPAKLRDAASNGDNTAQFIIATHYLNGDTTTQDYSKAAYWYGKSAAAGLAPAQYRLATMYERGTGVDKNLTTALKWYEAAGAMGNVKAMHNAAVIAAGPDAGGPDYAKAYKWFSLAAAHGLKDSEFNLAVLMERGLGTKQDTNEALFWYTAAAAQDDADAKGRVAVLSKTLTPAQVDAVNKRFKAWVPQKASDAANVVAVNDSQWNPSSKPAATAPANTQSMNDNPNNKAKFLLDKLGYRVGSLDGTLDAKTANAIKLFQIKEGLKATGQVTPDLLSTMQSRMG